LLCGVDTKLEQGGKQDLVTQVNGNWQLNPLADGQKFKIHGPQIELCGLQSSDWKGIAWQDYNENAVVPGWWLADNGTTVGPVRENVRTAGGCDVGQTTDCVMVLPIAVPIPAPVKDMGGVTGGIGMYVVAYGCFDVVATGGNDNNHSGWFLYDCSIQGPGSPGWTPGFSGLITIRLTE
jgi:hypothetical protein